MALAGRLPWRRVPGYLIAQFAGALCASAVLLTLLKGFPNYSLARSGLGANLNLEEMTLARLFGWELVMTVLFLFTVLMATRSDATAGFSALAIGGFFFAAHLIGVQFGGASLNPSRSFGPAVMQRGEAMAILWLFLAAPVVGGIVGWILYRSVCED